MELEIRQNNANQSKNEIVQKEIAHNEPIQLEQAISSAKPVSIGVTRFHHRIPFGDITIYANDISDSDFKQLVKSEEELQEKAKLLSRQEKALGIEWDKLDTEQNGDGKSQENGENQRLESSSQRFIEIDSRKDEIEQEVKALRKKQESLLDASFEAFAAMVDKSVVAISWKESGQEKYSREHGFESRATVFEVGNIIMARTKLGAGEQKNYKRR